MKNKPEIDLDYSKPPKFCMPTNHAINGNLSNSNHKIMKTQISQLRSGTKNQILNPNVDYSKLPKATSHIGHGGTNSIEVGAVWEKIKLENPKRMKAIVDGIELEFTAHWSTSGKSVSYSAEISKTDLEKKFYLKAAKKETPYISIQSGNIIIVSNGKKSWTHICPSFVEIL